MTELKENAANLSVTSRLMLKLLPVQVILAAVGLVNGLVSSFFASNFVGVDAMSAVGLYAPVNLFLIAVGVMLLGGSVIIAGRYIGANQTEKLQGLFSLDILIAILIGAVLTGAFLLMGSFDLTGLFTRDPVVRPVFNTFLVGQAIGVFPMVLGNLLTGFLSLENKTRRTTTAGVVYILVNVMLNFIFVRQLGMQAFGLALASSLGMWIFMLIQIQWFCTDRAQVRATIRGCRLSEMREIVSIGLPGAATNGYQTIRGLAVNHMLEVCIGTVGISAFAAADSLLRVFWAIPMGMLAVSRMMISVSVGEEDRQTLTDVMRVMMRRFLPIMCGVVLLLIVLAEPMTRIFFRDPSEPVYWMTVWGIRILPLCMPLSIILMHFVCYGQAAGKTLFIHILSLLDGVVCVVAFTWLLIGPLGMNSVYIANVLNGVVTTLVIIGYAWVKKRHFPRDMNDLMVVPGDFGVSRHERMDLSVKSMEGVVSIAQRVQEFCLSRGIDERRAHLSGLALEEMAGNIVDHGFAKDARSHSIDVRVVHKEGDVILRLRDDCVPFDPGQRREMLEGDDITKNIGIRMVYRIAKDVQYQNILGLNVLTMRIS